MIKVVFNAVSISYTLNKKGYYDIDNNLRPDGFCELTGDSDNKAESSGPKEFSRFCLRGEREMGVFCRNGVSTEYLSASPDDHLTSFGKEEHDFKVVSAKLSRDKINAEMLSLDELKLYPTDGNSFSGYQRVLEVFKSENANLMKELTLVTYGGCVAFADQPYEDALRFLANANGHLIDMRPKAKGYIL